jgi:hypothetical protein
MTVWYHRMGSMRQGTAVEHISKSLAPVAVLVAAAVVFVLGTAFLIASDATLSATTLGASSDLAQAGRWLQFLGGACALAAVCMAGWEVIVHNDLAAGVELAAAALGTLLLAIGLVASAASNGSSPAGPVTGAVGIGVWALLVLSRAARTTLAEQGPGPAPDAAPGPAASVPAASGPAAAGPSAAGGSVPGASVPGPSAAGGPVPGGSAAGRGDSGHRRQGQADLWLAAAIGLFILAIGYGAASASGRAAGIVAGLLQAVGLAVLAGSIAAARSRGRLRTRPVPTALTGLVLLAVSFLAAAVVAGLAFGTLSALGAGLAVVTAVELAGIVALGLAAWTRLRELYR